VRFCAGAVRITPELSEHQYLMRNRMHETARSHFVLAFGQEEDIPIKCMKLQCDMKYIRQECTRNTMKSKLGAKGQKRRKWYLFKLRELVMSLFSQK
jgi:hypothetical protein